MNKAEEADWKLRAETAEALLEAEREEIERLRAHIKDLENQLPDEEGGEALPEADDPDSMIINKLISKKELLEQLYGGGPQLSPEILRELMTPHMIDWSPQLVMDEYRYRNPPKVREGMLKKLTRMHRSGGVAAEVSLEMRHNMERDGVDARVTLKMSDNRTFHYAIGADRVRELRHDPRSAAPGRSSTTLCRGSWMALVIATPYPPKPCAAA